jgi:hypothetical protein
MASTTSPELKAWARGTPSTRWDAELVREQWNEIRREYKRRYRQRHPDRLQAMQLIYVARWKARQRGEEPPPLPDWQKELGGLEVVYARGYAKGKRPQRVFPLTPPKKFLQ